MTGTFDQVAENATMFSTVDGVCTVMETENEEGEAVYAVLRRNRNETHTFWTIDDVRAYLNDAGLLDGEWTDEEG